MTELTTGDYLAIAGLLAAFMALPGGITILMLKGLRADNVLFRVEIRETLSTLDRRISEVEQSKVSHTDWIRVSASVNNRMDRVSEQLAELSGKMDANFGVSSNLNRIAKALEDHAEPKS